MGILHFKASGSEYLRFSSDGSVILPMGADIAYAQVLGPVLSYLNESVTISTLEDPVSVHVHGTATFELVSCPDLMHRRITFTT